MNVPPQQPASSALPSWQRKPSSKRKEPEGDSVNAVTAQSRMALCKNRATAHTRPGHPTQHLPLSSLSLHSSVLGFNYSYVHISTHCSTEQLPTPGGCAQPGAALRWKENKHGRQRREAFPPSQTGTAPATSFSGQADTMGGKAHTSHGWGPRPAP